MLEHASALETFLVCLEAIGKLFLVALLGFLAIRWRFLSNEGLEGLTKLMIDVIVPAMLCLAMVRGFDLDTLAEASPLILLPALYIPLTVALCLLFFRLRPAGLPGTDRAVSAMAALPNSFYVPLPLALAVTSEDQHILVGVLIGVGVFAINPFQWTLGTWLVTGNGGAERRDWRQSLASTFNGPVLGVIVGAGLALLPGMPEAARGEAEAFAPLRMLFGAMGVVAAAMPPLAMIIVGALIAQCRIGHAFTLRSLLPVMLFRFLLVPGIIMLMLRWDWIPADPLTAFVLLLVAAAPPAMNLAIAARRYGGEWEVASGVQLIASLAAAIVLPVWMTIGLHLG